MPQENHVSRSTNINIRVAPEQRSLIDRAAALALKTRTDFILDAVTRAAEETILDQRLFQVSPEEFQAFQEALDRPAASNDRLRALLSRKPGWEK
ncbi:DUF1778 domain-containing protein [Desulfocurvibacter africanus]|uniref:type II toxin-antitoxin system TacA family antitoxin n=2 Tax=Desulfocurvibacter africanus TaxID=873 RepID=UPI00041260A0|nr:DUF1778 domain-containing protein [Desulfocurvibacter africanus]